MRFSLYKVDLITTICQASCRAMNWDIVGWRFVVLLWFDNDRFSFAGRRTEKDEEEEDIQLPAPDAQFKGKKDKKARKGAKKQLTKLPRKIKNLDPEFLGKLYKGRGWPLANGRVWKWLVKRVHLYRHWCNWGGVLFISILTFFCSEQGCWLKRDSLNNPLHKLFWTQDIHIRWWALLNHSVSLV